MGHFKSLAWGVLGLFFLGCGGSESDDAGRGGSAGTGAGTGGSAADAGSGSGGTSGTECSALAMALCSSIRDCVKPLFDGQYTDLASCIAVGESGCMRVMASATTGLTASIAAQCTETLTGAGCADVVAPGGPADCRPRGGTVEDGGACGDDWQCRSGHCTVPAGSACGVCSPLVGAGQTCTTRADCEADLICSGGDAQICTALSETGAQCGEGQPCRLPDVCRYASATATSGTCGAPAGPGEPCETGVTPCDLLEGLFCNPSTLRCQNIELAPVGSACGLIDGMAVGCQAGRCVTDAGLTGTCAPLAENGTPCSAEEPCRPGSRCVNGLCTIVDPGSCE